MKNLRCTVHYFQWPDMGDIPEPLNYRFLGKVSATPYDFDASRASATRACYNFVLNHLSVQSQ